MEHAGHLKTHLDTHLDTDGAWRQTLGELSWAKDRPALFLDRDGVIVEEVNYLHRTEEVALIPGAAAFIADANRSGTPVVVISNQAGIARGYFGWQEFADVQEFLAELLKREGAHIDAVLACPHHPEHPDRKPQPGLFHKAAAMTGVDLKASWIIGDKVSDLEAGRAAGLRGGVLVLTGHGKNHQSAVLALAGDAFEIRVEQSIREARYVLDSLSADGARYREASLL